MGIDNITILVRLLLALVLGGLIGLERESHGRAAGFRTHILVSLGSALIMIISIYAFRDISIGSSGLQPITYDPGRLAAQVVSGIGFLGAGTIMREGATIRGLTTAASLWTVAGIGMAAGAGSYYPAIIAALLVVLTLRYLSRIEKRFLASKREVIIMEISDEPGQLGAIASALGNHSVNIRTVDLEQLADNRTKLEIICDFPPKLDKMSLTAEIMQLLGVHNVSFGRDF